MLCGTAQTLHYNNYIIRVQWCVLWYGNTHQGEDVPGLMEGGHSLPVEAIHESKPSTVGLDLGRNGSEELWEHCSVRESGCTGSI